MKTKDFKNKLRAEAEQEIPDLKAKILAQADEEGLFERREIALSADARVTPPKKQRRRGRIFGALAACAACVALILPFVFRSSPASVQPSYTTVCMKINPTIEFIVDEGRVVKTKALNKDGAVLLVHSSFEGEQIEQACLQVADMAGGRNLITERGITLYVEGENEEQIEKRISQKIGDRYALNEGGADYQALAEGLMREYGISKGKARLAAEAITLCNIPEKRAVRMSAEDLHEEIEDYQEEEMEAFERELIGMFDSEYQAYKLEVAGLLESYRERLDELNQMDEATRLAEIEIFNGDFSKLGEDFQIDVREPWTEAYAECVEEIEEKAEEFQKDPEEAFRDLFEDWLEEFQEGRFGDD